MAKKKNDYEIVDNNSYSYYSRQKYRIWSDQTLEVEKNDTIYCDDETVADFKLKLDKAVEGLIDPTISLEETDPWDHCYSLVISGWVVATGKDWINYDNIIRAKAADQKRQQEYELQQYEKLKAKYGEK